MKTPLVIVLVLPLLLASLACDSKEGPCLHEKREALFHVQSAQDDQTGAAITPIVFNLVLLEGVPVNGVMLVTELSSNVEFVQGHLLCSPPCSFGEEPGFYQFWVGAEGYAREVHELTAAYAILEEGCPSFSDEGVRFDFELRRE